MALFQMHDRIINHNGFTLVETLIVLAIGALLLAGISNAIAGFAPALERVQNNSEDSQVEANLISLEHILKVARFIDSDQQAFTQKQNALTFLSRAPIASGKRGYIMHQLQFIKENNEGIMRLKTSDNELSFPSVDIMNSIDKVIFPEQIDLLAGSQRQDGNNQIIISLANGDQRRVSINPMITETKTCVFDPISQACRE